MLNVSSLDCGTKMWQAIRCQCRQLARPFMAGIFGPWRKVKLLFPWVVKYLSVTWRKTSYRNHVNDYQRCQSFLLVLDNHVADDKSCYTPRRFMLRIMKAKHWIFVDKSSYISKHCLAKSTMFPLHVYCPNQNATSCLLHVRLYCMLYIYRCNNS